ncbi:HlyD family secretion protein [Flavobacterium nitrogenifigens]|uniref:HlyD family secretion protein n=2 Tax=Flavobacterium TaxID=237 RepID=A0A7W7IUD1_9FLAO|nr:MULTISPECIES: HlyD family efflux transporter periplasmic adaptor subunit [Flavobacterium]MBB4800695.1 HlyD family secretion protein [Flavobacterium nitrogenifigens]MBB6385558.1 HlyD family secretion protein [Flavobacterium notoginsengisoli]
MNFTSDPINTLENLISRNKTKSYSIYLIILLALITFLALLPIIKMDISSQSRGIIRSKTDNVPVTTIVSGKINWIALKNNVFVNKGDTLLKISKENLESDKRTQDVLSDSVSLLLSDINNLLQDQTIHLQTSTAREDFFKFQSGKNELQSKISQAKINCDRNKILYDKDIIAKADFEKYEYELRLAKQKMQSFISQQKATWENQKRDLEDRLKNLNGTVAKINAESNNYFVLAPISGTIENFSGIQKGSFINASQSIATISSVDHLIVENSVAPNDIGLIKKNQKVKFQLDAFNYNQWGLLEGKVIDIDHNITIQGEQAFFKVRCSLNSNALHLKSGYKTDVSKGMTLTTRYIITRRSLFDLLFDKIDNWLNPKQLSAKK